MRISIAGNPNVGKTVIFNALTRSHQHVANFPGCTVEHKEGKYKIGDKTITVIDLPGTYSLNAYSEDERVSREYIINHKSDLMINVIDASNLERNLFLTIQLLELGIPIIIVLNMIDVAESKGNKIDLNQLSKNLGVKIIPMVAIKGIGISELFGTIVNFIDNNNDIENSTNGFIREGEIKELENKIVKLLTKFDNLSLFKNYPYNWLALEIIEQDIEIIKKVNEMPLSHYQNLFRLQIHELIEEFQIKHEIKDTCIYIANQRYKTITNILKDVFIRKGKATTDFTTKLDDVLTDKYLGMPIFLASLWFIFQFTFTLSQPFVELLDFFFTTLSEEITRIIKPPEVASFIVGIINGVGAIIVFVPVIFLLYFAMAWLEDSGYLSRSAFIMDKWMDKIGLHGKAFIPLMLGFGCSVPAIMATRSIKDREDRLITIAIAPFISCSARLPVYVFFAGIFFPDYFGLVIIFLYVLGIFVAALVASILNKFIFKHKDNIFILELPEFQKPQITVAIKEMWLQGSLFLRKAATIIFSASIFVWFLSNIPFGVDIENTILAFIGKLLVPIFAPFGWDWQFITALLLGILAKEIIIATIGVVFKGDEGNQIPDLMTSGQALSYLSFILLYIPCMATLAVIKSETGSKKITLLLFLLYIGIAYLVSLTLLIILNLVGVT